MIRLDPITRKRLQRFRSIKRGYYSLIGFAVLLVFTLLAELFVSNRAVLVEYQDEWYFPTYGDIIPGRTFGFDYDYETDYRELKTRMENNREDGFVILPLAPWNAFQTDLPDGEYPPFPPSLERQHYLGTDTVGRDILARLVYGFRTAIIFSLVLLVCNFAIGIIIGCLMGYWGGWFDLLFQRVIEIWTNIPFLYVIIIVSSIVTPNFKMLIAIMIFFGWTGMTWYMRTATYKEKAREYALAATTIGASTGRTIFHHILPNTVSLIVTFIPFSVTSGIVALTSLDFLGFGLPPPTPSWGELLKQGTANLDAQWIVGSVVIAMTVVLTMITFIGEAIREAFDPKKHTTYE